MNREHSLSDSACIKLKYPEDNLSRWVFAHANITWNVLGSNQGLRDGKPVIKRLNHDTVLETVILIERQLNVQSLPRREPHCICTTSSRLIMYSDAVVVWRLWKIVKSDCYLHHVCPSVQQNNSAPTGRHFIKFIKFDISGFFENLSRKFKFH